MPTLVIATSNTGKVREFAQALTPLGWDCVGLGGVTLPEETGTTYAENARLKAEAAARATGHPALADDSGIEVAALGGAPGVYSARYGNLNSDAERNAYLLAELGDHPDRRAKFVSVLVLAYPDGRREEYRGEVAGELLGAPRGEGGFGYDPLFVPEGETRTLAELSVAEKQAVSHRGRAVAELLRAHGVGAT